MAVNYSLSAQVQGITAESSPSVAFREHDGTLTLRHNFIPATPGHHPVVMVCDECQRAYVIGDTLWAPSLDGTNLLVVSTSIADAGTHSRCATCALTADAHVIPSPTPTLHPPPAHCSAPLRPPACPMCSRDLAVGMTGCCSTCRAVFVNLQLLMTVTARPDVHTFARMREQLNQLSDTPKRRTSNHHVRNK
jgi:hypothetical protein